MALITKLGARRKITIEYDGEPITIFFSPKNVSEEKLRELQNSNMSLSELLADVLVDWDIIGEDNKPFPITPENLRTLPIDLLVVIQSAILESMFPNLTKQGGFAAP